MLRWNNEEIKLRKYASAIHLAFSSPSWKYQMRDMETHFEFSYDFISPFYDANATIFDEREEKKGSFLLPNKDRSRISHSFFLRNSSFTSDGWILKVEKPSITPNALGYDAWSRTQTFQSISTSLQITTSLLLPPPPSRKSRCRQAGRRSW